MKIIIDGFGGDLAPLAPLQAAEKARRELGVSMAVTGDREKLIACAGQNGVSLEGVEIIDASQVMPMEEEPKAILKAYSDSSMAVGLKAVAAGEGDAFVSSGSTGALILGATFLVKRIRGIKRPVLGTPLPTRTGFYLLADAGANHDCRPEMLVQFAVMGAAYQKAVNGLDDPRVGLINIGAEETKGTELQVKAIPLLKEAPVNFVGNVEPRDLPMGACDVALCDGFTGNVILKLTEGLARYFSDSLKDIFLTNAATKAAALAVRKPFAEFKKSMDYREQGGVPILGVRGPVIKAHGASDGPTLFHAVRQAKICVEHDVIGEIQRGVEQIRMEEGEA